MEKHILPNGEGVDFDPLTHTYFVRGTVVPSITTLLKNKYGDSYAAVNPELLKRSSDYGTSVHEELQTIIEMRKENPDIPLTFNHLETENYFKFVEPIYHIDPVATEKVVVLYDNDGVPVSAGRFDLLCTVDHELTLADFKTTSAIHMKLVSAQLNLYKKACIQSGYCKDGDIKKLGVIHLSGSTCKYKPIPMFEEEFFKQFIDII